MSKMKKKKTEKKNGKDEPMLVSMLLLSQVNDSNMNVLKYDMKRGKYERITDEVH